MTKLSAADIAALPAHLREQIPTAQTKMGNKERARQQYKPKQARLANNELSVEWRNLTDEQRRARMVYAPLREFVRRLGSHYGDNLDRVSGNSAERRTAIRLLETILASVEEHI